MKTLSEQLKKNYSIIPACDVSVERYEELIKATADVDGVSAYKLGFVLALSIGLPRAVEIARKYTDKPLIYDHQKAATDIPETGEKFMKTCKAAGIDAVILFPQAGPETEKAWIQAAQDEELGVIVGGLMTHKGYAQSDGGWLADDAILEIYLTAVKCGVTEFVVPGSKPMAIRKIRKMLERENIAPVFYSPGIGAQGGVIAESLAAAGGKWHPIIGRAIYNAEDMQAAAKSFFAQLT